jgi:hypothetical protein
MDIPYVYCSEVPACNDLHEFCPHKRQVVLWLCVLTVFSYALRECKSDSLLRKVKKYKCYGMTRIIVIVRHLCYHHIA